MAEPASTAAAGAAALGWKVIGSAAGVMALGGALAALVVRVMSRPRTDAEWRAALISTLLSSICGGAAVILRFELLDGLRADNANAFLALVALLGLVFCCGLPGWAAVRWAFTWMERRRDRDLGEIAAELRGELAGVHVPLLPAPAPADAPAADLTPAEMAHLDALLSDMQNRNHPGDPR